MNGTYYQNPTFPNANNPVVPETNNYTSNIQNQTDDVILDMEQSYIENVLRQNKGKKVRTYVSFPDSSAFKDKIFEGYIRQAARDHLVMSLLDGKWILVPMIYMDFVEFEEEINYNFK